MASGTHADMDHSDDLVSDEELVVSTDKLEEALGTNVGGRKPKFSDDEDDGADAAELTHREN